ncbi:membrane-associated protein [Halobacteriales archaeon QS_1_68_20]|nr:MAG: membrane-associated protein [Halobacteriales archaeon QS_1_68_20]
MSKLSIKGFAVGFGIMWAIYMLFMGWAAMFGHGEAFVDLFSSHYPGFAPSLVGGVAGAVAGFVDGAITGGVIAFVYNLVVTRI